MSLYTLTFKEVVMFEIWGTDLGEPLGRWSGWEVFRCIKDARRALRGRYLAELGVRSFKIVYNGRDIEQLGR